MPRSAHGPRPAAAPGGPRFLSLLAVAADSPAAAAATEAPLPDGRLMAGIDEAGRGCLAGPVVAAAVILPPVFDLPGLTDSKACSARTRERLAPCIRQCAAAWGLGVVWPARIDQINILQATFEAMCRAVRCLRRGPEPLCPELLCIDGNQTLPPALLAAHWARAQRDAAQPAPLPLQQALVRGDARVPAISAASILAKTYRDALMTRLDRRWPGYGFAAHKGYGTREHLAALRRLGPCPLHRMTFAGVRPPAAGPAQGSLLP